MWLGGETISEEMVEPTDNLFKSCHCKEDDCERMQCVQFTSNLGHNTVSYEQQRKFITKIHANLVFWAMYLVFEVFQDIWHIDMENPNVFWNSTLSCPSMASKYANLYLVPISFWMLTIYLEAISFYRRASQILAVQTRVALSVFSLLWDSP